MQGVSTVCLSMQAASTLRAIPFMVIPKKTHARQTSLSLKDSSAAPPLARLWMTPFLPILGTHTPCEVPGVTFASHIAFFFSGSPRTFQRMEGLSSFGTAPAYSGAGAPALDRGY